VTLGQFQRQSKGLQVGLVERLASGHHSGAGGGVVVVVVVVVPRASLASS